MNDNNEKIAIMHVKVIFLHDRTCCVCQKTENKYIQIHHIDGNHSNNNFNNLCVLCLNCHTDTQVKGGFCKTLSPEIVTMYRDEWVAKVGKKIMPELNPEDYKPINFAHPSHIVDLYLQQFQKQNLLPLNTTFYFEEYFVLPPCETNIIVINFELNTINCMKWKSVLKAYILCALGEICPPGFLFTNTFHPEDAYFGVHVLGQGEIRIPNWFYTGLNNGNYLLNIIAFPLVDEKKILLKLMPLICSKNVDYSEFIKKSEILANSLKHMVLRL
jgi:hypothetical protein